MASSPFAFSLTTPRFSNKPKPAFSLDPLFKGWYDSQPKVRTMFGTGVLDAENKFNSYKASLPDSPQSIQKNMESQGLVYNSPFFPRGFNLQQFMIGRSANSSNNSGLGEKSYTGGRFNFRSS